MRCLHCVVNFQLQKLDCALTWYKNLIWQLQNCVALQLNQKVHRRNCTALQKMRILRYAFAG